MMVENIVLNYSINESKETITGRFFFGWNKQDFLNLDLCHNFSLSRTLEMYNHSARGFNQRKSFKLTASFFSTSSVTVHEALLFVDYLKLTLSLVCDKGSKIVLRNTCMFSAHYTNRAEFAKLWALTRSVPGTASRKEEQEISGEERNKLCQPLHFV